VYLISNTTLVHSITLKLQREKCSVRTLVLMLALELELAILLMDGLHHWELEPLVCEDLRLLEDILVDCAHLAKPVLFRILIIQCLIRHMMRMMLCNLFIMA
jgi:hypothetical protein